MKNKLISFILALCLLIAIPLSARYKYNPFTRKLDYYETGADIDLGDLADVTLTGLATGNVLYYNGTAWVNLATGNNGEILTLAAGLPSWAAAAAPSFLGLTDTPAAYAGKAGQFVIVNAVPDGLEFFAGSAAGTVIVADGSGGWTKDASFNIVSGKVSAGGYEGTAIANAYIAGIDQDLLTTSSPTHIGLSLTGELDITKSTTLLIDLNPGFQGSGVVIEVIPSAVINTVDAEWDAINIDGSALDPSVAGVEVHGIHVAFTDVDTAQAPFVDGARLMMPTDITDERIHSLHANRGFYLEADIGTAVAGLSSTTIDVVYSTTGATGGKIHALDVAEAGTGTVSVTALGTHAGVDVIHQHIGAITAFDQVWEYDNDGPGWTDITAECGNPAVDVQIWDDADDEVYFGQDVVFDEIPAVWNTVATKDMFLDFYYSAGGAGWTPFIPSDDTLGGRVTGIIRFLASDLAGWATDTVNGTANKYWIRVERTRISGVGPTEDTIKYIAGVSYEWDEDGEISIKDITVTTPVNVYGLSHNSFADYDANKHVDHTAVSVLSGGLISGGGTIDGNQTLTLTEATIEGAIDTLGAIQFTGDVEFLEDITVTWADAADHMVIDQNSVVGTENQALIRINDDRQGTTVDEYTEASLYINSLEGWGLCVKSTAQFNGDTIQIEDIFWTWTGAIDHAEITQTNVTGTDQQPLILIDDDRTGTYANELSEATIYLDAAGTYAFNVAAGQAYFQDDTTQIEDVFMTWADALDKMVIAQSAVEGTEDVPLIFIDDDRTGATASELGEATIVIDAEGVYALYVKDGTLYAEQEFKVAGNVLFWEDFELAYSQAGDHVTISQIAVAGIEDQPLINIDDDRTGTTTDEEGEATIFIDAEGSYALVVQDGYSVFNDRAYYLNQLNINSPGSVTVGDDVQLMFGSGQIHRFSWDTNGAQDAMFSWWTGNSAVVNNTNVIFVSNLFPVADTGHNDYLSPTFIITNDEGADANDYSAVLIGERTQANVKIAHYFDFYAMTGAVDGSVDTADELAAIFRFGASGTGIPDFATTPGDVLFEGSVEIDGALWVADNPIRENLLSNSGFGVWSQSDASKGLATITYDNGAKGGGAAPSVGDAIVAGTSGATAKVISYTIGGGTWDAGDAIGVLTVGAVSHDFAFVDNETLTFDGVETCLVNMADTGGQVGLVQNGGFARDADPPPGWTAGNAATLTTEGAGEVGNCLMIANGAGFGFCYQAITTVVGKIYKFVAYYKKGTSDSGNFRIGTTAGGNEIADLDGLTDAAWALYTITFEATATTTYITCRNETNTVGHTNYYDEITAYEITPCATAADGLSFDTTVKDTTLDIYRQHSDGGTLTKDGSFYSLKAVPTTAADYLLMGFITEPADVENYTSRPLTMGCWAKTSTASHFRIQIQEVGGTTSSSYHTGGGGWEWLEVTQIMSAATTYVYGLFQFSIVGNVDGSTIVYHSQPKLVFGSAIGEGNYQPKSQEMIWLDKYIGGNKFGDKTDFSTSDGTMNLEADSDAMLPKGAKVVWVTSACRYGASAAATDCHLYLKTSDVSRQSYYNSVAGIGNDAYNYEYAPVKLNPDGDYKYGIVGAPAGTFDFGAYYYQAVQVN